VHKLDHCEDILSIYPTVCSFEYIISIITEQIFMNFLLDACTKYWQA